MLEIGPFDRPSLHRFRDTASTIDYADYLGHDDLVARAKSSPGRDPAGVPSIRYVLADGGYEQIRETYDAVVSHHCIEHQPDLIGHLQSVLKLLASGGVYLLTAPDYRKCFDHFLPPTTLIDVVTAHLEGRTKPGLQSVLEHRCFTRHDFLNSNNPLKDLTPGMRECLFQSLREYSTHDYVDVHCWKLTASSFRRLVHQLAFLGFLPAATEVKVYSLGDEFGALLFFDETKKGPGLGEDE